LFLAWLVIAQNRQIDPETIILNLLLLHSWAVPGPLHFSLNGPSWSLSNEMFFYVIFPALIYLRPRSLAIITAAGIVIVAVLASWSAAVTPMYSSDVEWFFYVNPLVRLIEFTAGMLVHTAWRTGRFRRYAGTQSEIALIVLAPIVMIGVSSFGVPLPLRYQLAYLPLMVAFVFIFACGHGAISRGLCARPLILLGQASFSLYLVHRPIFTLSHQLSERFLGKAVDLPLAIGLLAGCSAISVLVYRRVETPIQRLLRRKLQLIFPPRPFLRARGIRRARRSP
jgi:peptidoglycan/LPS O-acetylase OafA/YrhL